MASSCWLSSLNARMQTRETEMMRKRFVSSTFYFASIFFYLILVAVNLSTFAIFLDFAVVHAGRLWLPFWTDCVQPSLQNVSTGYDQELAGLQALLGCWIPERNDHNRKYFVRRCWEGVRVTFLSCSVCINAIFQLKWFLSLMSHLCYQWHWMDRSAEFSFVRVGNKCFHACRDAGKSPSIRDEWIGSNDDCHWRNCSASWRPRRWRADQTDPCFASQVIHELAPLH